VQESLMFAFLHFHILILDMVSHSKL